MIKKIAITLFAAMALVATAGAQATPKVLTVDMGKLYQGYEKAKEAEQRFNSSVQNAQEEIKAMIEEGRAMTDELRSMQEKLNSPVTAESAKVSIQAQMQEKAQGIREKEVAVTQFRQETDRKLQQRKQTIIELHVSEIREVVIEVAKDKGANLILNTNGAAVVYVDDSFDITDEVAARLGSGQ